MKTEKNYSSLAKDNSQFTRPLNPSHHKGWGKISAVDIKNRKVAFTLAEGATHVALPKGYRRTAFTLAEVLITIGIIGVVAALTVPHFVQNYTERATVVKLKKVYSTLDNAYKMAQAEHGYEFRKDLDWSKAASRREFLEMLMPYLEVAVDCRDNKNMCRAKHGNRESGVYYSMLERKWPGQIAASLPYAVLLKDGTLIVIFSSPNPSTKAVRIFVDINGPAKPNQYGWDSFFFNVENPDKKIGEIGEKIRPLNAGKSSYHRPFCKLGSTDQALSCAWWVLNNENMDYLHCDLDWATQTKCSDKK